MDSASVPASIVAVLPLICLVSASACASALLATFFMEEGHQESVVSKMSNTFTILFLLGVIAELFSAFSTVASTEGLRISGIFAASSVFDFQPYLR
jgi:Na+/H+-translocating membrane pyrophosphatase